MLDHLEIPNFQKWELTWIRLAFVLFWFNVKITRILTSVLIEIVILDLLTLLLFMFNIKVTQIVKEIVILVTYTFLSFRFNVKITQILEKCSNRDIYLNTSNFFAV